MKSSYAPPWLFGLTNLPFGVAGSYTGVAMPFLLREAGVPVDTIAALAAIVFLPAAYQLFWAPVLDLGIRRRSWLVLCACSSSLCLAATLFVKLPEQLLVYEVLVVAGQALAGLVASCNGALVATRVDPRALGRAAGWVNAANLGASALGGGLVLTLAQKVSPAAAALALAISVALPSLAALAIDEPPPAQDRLDRRLAQMAREVSSAVRSRKGWTGLVFCISPVGTVALVNLFGALGKDYGASNDVVTWVNGYLGGFVTAGGALACGFFLDRLRDRRRLYLASGVCTAICAIGMSLAPRTPTTYIVGCLIYLLIAGMAYAAFSAVVYEIVGDAGRSASTLYSVFPAVGNQAIAYMLLLDGGAQHLWGTRGLWAADAALNAAGVAALMLLLRVVRPERSGPAAVTPAAIGDAEALKIGGAT